MNRERGQSLLEVLVALSAVLIMLSAITVIVLNVVNQSVESKNRNLATQYAQEGVELARAQEQVLSGTNYCLGTTKTFVTDSGTTCSAPNLGTTFIRKVQFVSASCSGARQVTVTVSWRDAKCAAGVYCHTVPVTTCL